MYKRAKNKIILLILLILTLSAVFIVINYNNYLLTEKKFNYEKIEYTIDNINRKITYLHRITNDYANWDDTYYFLKNENTKYIYSNFREGSKTLEDLDIDFLILENKNEEIKYSKFTKQMNDIDKFTFKREIISKLKNNSEYRSIIRVDNEPYIIVKKPILKTDFTGETTGNIYMGVHIDSNLLEEFTKDIEKIEFINLKHNHNQSEETSTSNIPKILLHLNKINKHFANEIYIYDSDKSKVTLAFKLDVKSEIIEEISVLLSSFILMVIVIILSLIYIYFKFKKEILEHEELVNSKVDAKTDQIKVAMLELEKVNGKLYEIAHTDELTKTMNRRNFFIHAQNAFTFARKENKPLCVVMVDLDKFKSINDTYGHDVGDEVLIAFAKNIMKNIEQSDVFGRLGGEEFALIFKDVSLEKAVEKAEKLKKVIENIEVEIEDKALKFTASFGVSDIDSCKNIDEMLQKADKQLYKAKESGRNIVRSRLNK